MRGNRILYFSLLLLSPLQILAFQHAPLKTIRTIGFCSTDIKGNVKDQNISEASGKTMTLRTLALQVLWKSVTCIGMRRLRRFLQHWFPNNYGDTIFCWEDCPPVQNYVALTIDDGLCRGKDPQKDSMVSEVRELLKEYNATATFFVCTDYVSNDRIEAEALLMIDDGHEFGNHLKEDRSGYYCYLGSDEFRQELLEAESHLARIYSNYHKQYYETNKRRRDRPEPWHWFRAPQGLMSKNMCQVLKEEGITSVLGDCYCDDWAFAQDGNIQPVAPIMLSQLDTTGGSIAIFHMPQRGFREGSLKALRLFLEGVKRKNMHCISLTEMMAKLQTKQM
eukprot:scaffold858_cov123-Cylindrotheca_fusiformis.AAC.22